MKLHTLFSLCCLGLFGTVFPVAATSFFDSASVDLAATARYYVHEKDRNKTVNNQFSHGVKGEFKFNKSSRGVKFNTHLFANWDSADEPRRYYDFREANVYVSQDNLKFGLGVDTFFWGVSESINIANVLNQADIMESIDGKVKLGQTFVSLSNRVKNGYISVYYLPVFREQAYPERPVYGLPVSEYALFEKDKKNGGIAARGLFYIDEFEFALSFFKGTRRSPLLLQSVANLSVRSPYYLQTENFIFDGVYLLDDFTVKLELKTGKELEHGFTASNLGLEYPSYAFSEYIEEVIFIAEYVFDDRGEQGESHGQNDIFLGTKFDFGHSNQGSVRFLYSYDFDFKSEYAELSYEYRLSDYFRFKSKFTKVLSAPMEDKRLFALSDEEFFKLSIHYAF
ncbi:hypothetical protein [Pseudoalteromonas ostreae]|uniref:hypothetical protein n=1 Tax=Pseudoalteromonas ostreae TaxID=2774154 RepID=UPI001B397BD8|nr:hypothetical protein [Pseudoalteromonas ostreae]